MNNKNTNPEIKKKKEKRKKEKERENELEIQRLKNMYSCSVQSSLYSFQKRVKKKLIIFWVSKFLGSKSTQILINMIFCF